MTSNVFQPFLTYLVSTMFDDFYPIMSNIWDLFWTPLPTLKSDVIYGRSLSGPNGLLNHMNFVDLVEPMKPIDFLASGPCSPSWSTGDPVKLLYFWFTLSISSSNCGRFWTILAPILLSLRQVKYECFTGWIWECSSRMDFTSLLYVCV